MTEAWVKPLGGETAHAARIDSLKTLRFHNNYYANQISGLPVGVSHRVAENEPNLLVCLSRRQN
jgi:hypothetical protein